MQRKVVRLLPSNTVFFECDMQEKMRKIIKNFDTVAHNATRLTKTANIFKIPIVSTQQIPRVFGQTITELTSFYDKNTCFAHTKADFSMLEQPVKLHLEQLQRKNVVLYGVEAHVCVKQSCLELLENDYSVTLVVDAISSMNYNDRNVAIESMRDAGAQVTTFQSLVFELARNPKIPEYKDLLKLIKDAPKDLLELHTGPKI